PSPQSTTANITPLALTVSATGVNKVYDGTTQATANLTGNSLPGDVVTFNYTAAFADKNVANGKAVSVTGIALEGADAGNYTLASTTATTTANITARAVTVTANAKTKVFGQADPALTYQVTTGSVVAGDSFSGSLTRAPGQSVGSYPIQQGTLSLGSNYNLTYVGANLTITKAQAASTITSSVSSTVYGQVVNVNVRIYSPSGVGTPTGTVVLYDGNVN